MAEIVLAHGAWSSAWAWRRMAPLMAAAGHRFWTPSLTGLGRRAHLASPQVDLETHIQDVLAVLETEDLRDAVLLGHSYGGMVATGVADRARDRIARLIYLDAIAPEDGESLFDAAGTEARAIFEARIAEDGEGWRIAPNPMPPDTSPEDLAWAAPRRALQPAETFRRKLRLRGGPLTLPIAYVYCMIAGLGDGFARFRDKALVRGWETREIEASHNPHITCPEALMALLDEILAG
ncbi:MAG: alpha/beta hydrolase [Pseudomonadota bacterium]